MDQIADQMKAFIGFLGASVAAFIGLWARHATDPGGFQWRRLMVETPVAIMCGIVAGAIGFYFELGNIVTLGIASAFAYISPPVVFSIVRKKLEKDDDGENN